jgi:hypothetical protein
MREREIIIISDLALGHELPIVFSVYGVDWYVFIVVVVVVVCGSGQKA